MSVLLQMKNELTNAQVLTARAQELQGPSGNWGLYAKYLKYLVSQLCEL